MATTTTAGAAGATGSVVAQIARLKGCRVVGIAGGQEKCEWLRNACQLDAVIDYKNENMHERLAALCPDGINVFFDNVNNRLVGKDYYGNILDSAIVSFDIKVTIKGIEIKEKGAWMDLPTVGYAGH